MAAYEMYHSANKQKEKFMYCLFLHNIYWHSDI